MVMRKVRYGVVTLNLIFTTLVLLKFDSNTVTVMYNASGGSVLSLGKWVLIFFGLLPLLFFWVLSIFEKHVYTKEKYSSSQTETLDQKVFPIISVILLLVSWVIVLTCRAKITEGYIEMSGWLFMVFGAIVMYASNYITKIRPHSFLMKLLPSKAKDESLWNKATRLMSYSGSTGGYIILITGVFGMIYNNKNLMIAGFMLSVFCIVIPTCMYMLNLHKKLRLRKSRLDEKKNKAK